MKEIIINITADATMASGHKVVIPNAADYATFRKNNVLGILNKTRTQSHFTPMQWANLTSVVYDSSAHTLTLNLAAASYPITAGDELFIKLYTNEEGGGGGIEIMTDDEYEPALSDLENMLDDIDVTDEN